MTEIRELTQEYFEDAYQLNVYAFHFKETEDSKERLFNELAYGQVLGSFSDDRLTSALIIFPFEVYYHGNVLKMGGIGNVTSYPEVRGKGSVRQLMERALKEMKDQGTVLSYLSPFSYHFYRKFGYEVAFEKRQYNISPDSFGSFKIPEKTVERVVWKEQKEAVKDIYDQKMKDAVGPVKRDDWIWENRIMNSEEKKLALYRDETGAPKGYLSYEFSGEHQAHFKINELHALTGQAEKALWEYIGTHAAGFNAFEYTARSDQRLTHLFREADLNPKIVSSMMARIVDMENFLKQFPFRQTENQEFWLEVTDDTAEWNAGLFKLSMSDGNIQVSSVEQPEDKSRYLKASIQTWTQLFMQFKKAADLQFEGTLLSSEDAARALQDCLPEGVPELHDFF